ncbi:MAG: hypothetical protein JWN44_5110 [Myxococcales bacterium]|nr:hypothetical protein [Myxococcales bacterium]
MPPHLLALDAEHIGRFVHVLPSKCGGMAEAEPSERERCNESVVLRMELAYGL